MIREELRDIILDGEFLWDMEECYAYDQAYISCPIVFPTVALRLVSTDGLNALADAIREDSGLPPLFHDDGYTTPWYNFYIDLNGFNDSHIDTCISVEIEPYDEVEDDLTSFCIDLSEEEQRYIYACIDQELKKNETGCETELRKAAEYFELKWRCPA